MIKFSIITITYNASALVSRTLKSVLEQTYPGIEHILVDGASTDGTLDIERRYKSLSDGCGNGHEVILKSEPDRGIYDAMNKGLGMATGDYVCFINAGDAFYEPETLELIAENARSCVDRKGHEVLPAVLYGDTDWTDADGNYLCRRPLTPPRKLSWRSFLKGMVVCHQAFYARADIARETMFDLRYRYSSDVDWCIRIMKKAAGMRLPLVNTHATVAMYMREGQTTLNHRASLKERFVVMRHHYGLFPTVAMHLWFVVRQVLRKL